MKWIQRVNKEILGDRGFYFLRGGYEVEKLYKRKLKNGKKFKENSH